MYGYMTNGTYEFLEKLKEKQNISPFLLMHNNVKTVAYYEDTHDSIFELSRNYEILGKTGTLQEVGFVSFTHIPVTEEGRPIFEMEYKEKVKNLSEVNGVEAARVLRPFTGNDYILLIEWSDQKSYQSWENIDPIFQEKKASYIATEPYNETFQVGEEEEEEK